jgi:hypothetical protein
MDNHPNDKYKKPRKVYEKVLSRLEMVHFRRYFLYQTIRHPLVGKGVEEKLTG